MNLPTAALEVAATVVLLRDGPAGPETLMLERPSDRGSFAGAWVFPGGRVDPEDRDPAEREPTEREVEREVERDAVDETPGDGIPADHVQPVAGGGEERSARRAAVRELHEETGLRLAVAETRLISCWTPPPDIPRRFRTWFYLAPAPAGGITLSADEAVDHVWVRPADALDSHAAGRLQLVAPTWVTLHLLAGSNSVEALLAAAGPVNHFHTRHTADGQVLLWEPDVAYSDDGMLAASGPRHRLEIARRPWVYTRSAAIGRAAE